MNFTTIENAIYSWVQSASGLAADKVIWERQSGRRPDGLWIGLSWSVTPRGRDWVDAVSKPLVLVSGFIESIDTGTDEATLTGHTYVSGDGPMQTESAGSLPGGLEPLTDYWLVVQSADTVSFAASFVDSVAAVPVLVNLTSGGTGIHIIVDTDDTVRAGEEIEHTVRGNRRAELTIQCYGADATEANRPASILGLVMAKSKLPSISDALDIAGIGIGSFGILTELDLPLGAVTEVRGLLTAVLHLVEEVSEDGTIIETAELTADPPIT